VTASTSDQFLGGRVVVQQPQDGFRSGLDAVVLGAAVPASQGEECLELGSGAGAASLCLAWRCQGCTVVGVEKIAELVDLAAANARANAIDARVTFVAGDVFEMPAALKRDFDHVLTNPPFHNPGGAISPHAGRAAAVSDDGRLAEWLSAGLRRVRSNGTLTIILRADRIAEALKVLPDRGCRLFPLWPRTGVAAKRIILQVHKGSREPLELLSGLVLHAASGDFTLEVDRILRDGASLALSGRAL
jgi:tRNA1(Val) A37 N6-methylase TrmN6